MKKFKIGNWQKKIDVRDFIQKNYTSYEKDDSFLEKQTARTQKVWDEILELQKKEHEKGGTLDVDTKIPSTITSHEAGYIDQKNEVIVGLQTDAPLKRAIKPRGGARLVERACNAYGYELDKGVKEIFSKHVTSHNDAVFSMYDNWADFHTPDGKLLRKKGILTGLPDNYARGRIIGDYRRVALYGIDRLIEDKIEHLNEHCQTMNVETMHKRDEMGFQLQALKDLKIMADKYGMDISKPAQSFQEAVQWLYFGYLAAVKEQDGAAMSMGRIDAFLDIFAEAELQAGTITESEVQEIIDDFVIKLRIVKHLRVPEYYEIFAGDPTWITLAIGGMGEDGRTLVTKMAFRFLHTLVNLGPSPEPNITVLWSDDLPQAFKNFASDISIQTSALQFENDEIMRPHFSDDYGIACCVSAMKIGKQMQFFGARCNLAKLLLMTLNEGRDEFDGSPIAEDVKSLKNKDELDYEEVKEAFFKQMKWIAKKYVATMNVIHYNHDKYFYENSQMALHDSDVERFMAFGIAGFSVVVDSLSAMKHAQVKAIRNEAGIAIDFEIEGEYPTYGSDDDRVDNLGVEVVNEFIKCLREHETYRDSIHTLSLLTITSNVMYGHHTGATPDGRKSGEPFAPGANPMHGRDHFGAISSLNSVAKIPYESCMDGISNTFSITPKSLGKSKEAQIKNLSGLLDGYFNRKAHHLNVNVLDRETLQRAMRCPEEYPNLTIRVSGYAVKFINLSKEQQEEVISRTFHDRL